MENKKALKDEELNQVTGGAYIPQDDTPQPAVCPYCGKNDCSKYTSSIYSLAMREDVRMFTCKTRNIEWGVGLTSGTVVTL